MEIIYQIRRVAKEIDKLQANQKPVEKKVPRSPGDAPSSVDPALLLIFIEEAVEKLYIQLIDAQQKLLDL